MTPTAWQRCGLVAAIGVFAMPVLVSLNEVEGIRRALDRMPFQSSLTALLAGVSLALQAACVVALVRPRDGAALFGRRLAILHALVALTIFTAAAFGEHVIYPELFDSWYCGWFGLDTLRNTGIAMRGESYPSRL